MSDLSRLANLIFYIPTYGPGALMRDLEPEPIQRDLTLEDMEAMHPGLFGAN